MPSIPSDFYFSLRCHLCWKKIVHFIDPIEQELSKKLSKKLKRECNDFLSNYEYMGVSYLTGKHRCLTSFILTLINESFSGSNQTLCLWRSICATRFLWHTNL